MTILEFVKETLQQNPNISKTACAELMCDKFGFNSNEALKVAETLRKQHDLKFKTRAWGGAKAKEVKESYFDEIIPFIKDYCKSGRKAAFIREYGREGIPNDICRLYNKNKSKEQKLTVNQIKAAIIEIGRRKVIERRLAQK